MNPAESWAFLLPGYLLSIAIETPVLLAGLSPCHTMRQRLFAGVWLTACTYPIVILVLPFCFPSRSGYLWVAETFAPVAECALFWLAIGSRAPWTARSMLRDFAVILLANLASFGFGEVILSM